MYANFRKVIVPATPKPTTSASDPTPTQDPDPIPTQDPDPIPTSLSCFNCNRHFISILNVRGVVAQARDPNTRYYVTPSVRNILTPEEGLIIHETLTANDQETNLALKSIHCWGCGHQAGWKVLQQLHPSQTHPIVNTGHFLLSVLRPSPPPPPPPPPPPAPLVPQAV